MIFNTVSFLLFLVIVTFAYWILDRRKRLWLIFISSLVFYGSWRIEYVPLLLISVCTDFYCAKFIKWYPNRKRYILYLSLLVNIGLLSYFKYSMFFLDNINLISIIISGDLSVNIPYILLPLGISFYTFQSISYTVDVYRGSIDPEDDFLLFANYVIFFPQLVAGPILRASEVIHQLNKRPIFNLDYLREGISRIITGLFLKVVLADNIGQYVDIGFRVKPENLSGPDVWAIAFLFGFQIYFDFSAYSHIAIGCAKLMGITFPENFNFPYLAVSPRDFWKRWHISLSSWIRDYVYLPLLKLKVQNSSTGGLERASDDSSGIFYKRIYALFATWFIMGLWHGAAWGFAFWGVWHATLIMGHRITSHWIPKFPGYSIVGWIITLPMIMIAWIPFRAQELDVALKMMGIAFDFSQYKDGITYELPMEAYSIVIVLLPLVSLGWVLETKLRSTIEMKMPLVATYDFIKYVILFTGAYVFLRPVSQFIYFQF